MKTTGPKTEEFIEELRKCLRRITFLDVGETEEDEPGELALEIGNTGAGEDIRLLVETSNNGQPRMARHSVERLLFRKGYNPQAVGVFMAPYISPGSAGITAEAGFSYADLAGNCRLDFGGIYIEQQGRPNPFAKRRDLRSLYSPKATRILRVLLSGPSRRWKTKPMAAEARVSIGLVSGIRKLLADREWIETGRDGFFLVSPGALLQEWSARYSFTDNRVMYFFALPSLPEVEHQLKAACERVGFDFALAGFSAADRYAPAVRHGRLMAFIDGDPGVVAREAGLREVDSGANVLLMEPYDRGVFYAAREIDGLPIVSPVQSYLDLASYRGRGAEAAKAVLDQELEPSW